MPDNKTSGKRKKDYVTRLAIGLFAFIILFELLIVTWLPKQLMNEKVWEREIAFQELVDLEDTLRSNIRGGGVKFRNKWEEGEASLVLDCLNEYAKYMREHQNDMNREQIGEIYKKLLAFERKYQDWKAQKYSVRFEKVHVDPVLKTLLMEFKTDERKNSKTKSL